MRPVATSLALAWMLIACGDSSGTGGSDASGGAGGSPTTSETSTGGASSAGGSDMNGAGGAGGSEGGAPPIVNGFPESWPDGTDCASEDPMFVWAYAPDTFILRQSLCTSFEGPFVHLLFGEDRALLLDTGDGGIPIRDTVRAVIDEWLAGHGKSSIELVVVHSHAHGDHTQGDSQFSGEPDTTVVGTNLAAVTEFFGMDPWPDQVAQLDLGGRVLDVIPIPGHEATHIALYDRRHELLFTGDTLYPGRLYVQNFATYVTSLDRLTAFVEAGNPVSWVLGCHIEMTTTPGEDFEFGADVHPNEHALELTEDHLFELQQAAQAMAGAPQYEAHDDFIIYPL